MTLTSFSTAWNTQTFSRGSYTSIGVGGQQKDIETLSSPLLDCGSEDKRVSSYESLDHCPTEVNYLANIVALPEPGKDQILQLLALGTLCPVFLLLT